MYLLPSCKSRIFCKAWIAHADRQAAVTLFLAACFAVPACLAAPSGVVLVLTAWLLFRRDRICPANPELAEQCEKVYCWNARFYWVSVGIWLTGFGTAYLALPIYTWLDGS